MRCPSCATENAPDSRFCGGCGARMPTAHSLVAPTQKMSDDTPYRPSGPQLAAALPTHPSQPPLMPAPAGDIRSVTTRPGPGAPPSSLPPQNHSYPPQNNHSVPPQNAPQAYSIPPQNQPRGSTPPAGQSIPPQNQAPSRPPRASSRGVTPAAGTSLPRGRAQTPAESVAAAPPARRWGLIIFVLLIDIGLASSGAWMLSQGLAN